MNSYNLSRQWFAFAFYHSTVKPVHTALYFWIIERANTSGWKKLIDIQTEKSMECLGITDWRTYKNALQFLTDSGFVLWIEKSKNQYTCNRISLVENAFELSESIKNNAQNVKANAQNAEAIAEAIAEAYVEADVEAIAEALQSYINLKTNKPINLKTLKQNASLSPPLFKDENIEGLKAEPKKPKEKSSAKKEKVGRASWKDLLIMPYDSEAFAEKWEEYIAYRKKPYANQVIEQRVLTSLCSYNEAFAIRQIDRAMEAGWSGLIYDQTPNEFRKFLANQNTSLQTNGQSTYTSRQQSANGVGADLETAVAMSRLIVSDGYKQAG